LSYQFKISVSGVLVLKARQSGANDNACIGTCGATRDYPLGKTLSHREAVLPFFKQGSR